LLLMMHLDLNTDNSLYIYGLTSVVVTFYVVFIIACSGPRKPSLAKIPTIGPDGLFISYLGAFRWFINAKQMVQDGYDKYKGSPFKVANISRWMVVVSGQKFVEELRNADDDVLSFLEAIVEDLAVDYTLGQGCHTDPYHVPVIRNQLTKNLGVLFPWLRDEVVQAFHEHIPLTTDWTKVRAYDITLQIVSQSANRLFVGDPLCRNPDWLALNIEFAIDVFKAATTINMFPNFMKPLAGRLLTNVNAQVNRGMKHLVPIIQDRQRHIDEYGKDWDDKPNDMLAWLMDNARGDEKSPRNLTLRVLTVNFAAIHTTSTAFTHTLYNLAAMPQYIQPLREEVEAVVAKDGWSKMSLTKMRKLDSFIRESLRFNASGGAISMLRKAVKDFTFSDGTFIPKNTIICVASLPMHHDDENYANADIFDPFRSADMRISEGEGIKHQIAATNPSFLVFGHGKHACPGRFFLLLTN